jgi:hypothetical protein
MIREEQGQGAHGGDAALTAWQTRVLNTIYSYGGTSVTLPGSNLIHFAAGTYEVRVSAPAFRVGNHQIRFSPSAGMPIFIGSSEYSDAAADYATTRSELEFILVVATASD